MPPIMGAAIRFMTSAPLSLAPAHIIGNNAIKVVNTVMTLGRIRLTAPM